LSQEKECILKPLHGMGGESIFRVSIDDPNINVIIETLTQHGKTPIMAQQYLSEIQQGDKRILMIDGKPFPYALARMPQQGETRANLAAGGKGIGIALSARDQWICDQVGPTLQALGLLFVGIDIIGDYLTEINVTSPTCLRELDQLYHANIADDVYQIIERKITEARKHKQ
jgi:glutathione synthase